MRMRINKNDISSLPPAKILPLPYLCAYWKTTLTLGSYRHAAIMRSGKIPDDNEKEGEKKRERDDKKEKKEVSSCL